MYEKGKKKVEKFLLLTGFLVHTLPTGLGFLYTIFNWEHLFGSFGSGEHFTRVIKSNANFPIPWFQQFWFTSDGHSFAPTDFFKLPLVAFPHSSLITKKGLLDMKQLIF